MKLGPVTEIDKRNMETLKKVDVGVMSIKCSVIVNFWIYNQFTTIWKPDSGHMFYRTRIFIK